MSIVLRLGRLVQGLFATPKLKISHLGPNHCGLLGRCKITGYTNFSLSHTVWVYVYLLELSFKGSLHRKRSGNGGYQQKKLTKTN